MENETTENVVIEINPTPVRDFITRYKTVIAVGATATVCLVLNRIAVRQHDEFLKEHELYDDFYSDHSDPSDL